MSLLKIVGLAAALCLLSVEANAKNETAPGNTDERMVSGVAGPIKPDANTPDRKAAPKAAQPTKAELKGAKVSPKPKLQDPN